jgi:ABC-type nitrate/sulfonate/bicarbonate transport system substrate-binding protein
MTGKTSILRRAGAAVPLAAALCALTLWPLGGGAAQPIRLGTGGAAAENLWLMDTTGGITPNRGKAYEFEFAYFRNAADRIKAYEAGQLDCLTSPASPILLAASKGVDFTVIASVSKESKRGAMSEFHVRADSDIKTIADLRGKVIANSGFKSATELYLRAALTGAGLNPDRDVRMTLVNFPQMADSLAAGKVDLAAFVVPFTAAVKAKGGTRLLFASRDVLPFDEDLITLFCSNKFLAARGDAVRAFLADFVATTKFYIANLRTARQHLLDAKKTLIEPAVFLAMEDPYRDPDCRLDLESWNKVQEAAIRAGFQTQRVDPAKFIDLGYLPKTGS